MCDINNFLFDTPWKSRVCQPLKSPKVLRKWGPCPLPWRPQQLSGLSLADLFHSMSPPSVCHAPKVSEGTKKEKKKKHEWIQKPCFHLTSRGDIDVFSAELYTHVAIPIFCSNEYAIFANLSYHSFPPLYWNLYSALSWAISPGSGLLQRLGL